MRSVPIRRMFSLLVCLGLLPIRAFGAEVPTVDEMLDSMQIGAAEKSDIRCGKIVSKEIGEGSPKELAIGIVMLVPAPLEKLVGAVKTETLLHKDPDVRGYMEMFTGPRTVSPAPALFDPKDSDEVNDLLEADPGDHFNLATSEFASLNALKAGKGDDSKRLGQVSGLCWQLLVKRFNEYTKGGLAAIAPFDRGGGNSARPGEELTLAAKESQLLAKYFPELQKALLEYPNSQPEGMIHRFFWISQKIEDRPTFILSHRMKYIRIDSRGGAAQGAFLAERQYFVGHSYNSMQILAGCLPVQGGTVVFYSNRTFTDQVAGFASGMKHSIGRAQMREEIVKGFEEIRAAAR